MNPKYSICLFAYDPEGKLYDMTMECISLIVKHSVGESYELIIHTEGGGVNAARNRAIAQACGEYLIFISNDVMVHDSQWLEKLTVPGKIASWHLPTNYFTKLLEPDDSCVCIPKEVHDKIGFLDPRFNDGYGFDDVDFYLRARDLGIEFVKSDVDIEHRANTTFQTYFKPQKEGMTTRNGGLFLEKWKNRPDLFIWPHP